MARRILVTNLVAVALTSLGCDFVADFRKDQSSTAGAAAGGAGNRGGAATNGGNAGAISTNGGTTNSAGTMSSTTAANGGRAGTGTTDFNGGSAGSGTLPSQGGKTSGGTSNGGAANGGVATVGGAMSGGVGNGGTSSGGATQGGAAGKGGAVATGGVTTTGGIASTGGAAGKGGSATGGVATGGVATGGVATGGVATGGVATGGVATGGAGTGGSKSSVGFVACASQFCSALPEYFCCADVTTGALTCMNGPGGATCGSQFGHYMASLVCDEDADCDVASRCYMTTGGGVTSDTVCLTSAQVSSIPRAVQLLCQSPAMSIPCPSGMACGSSPLLPNGWKVCQ